MKQAFLAVLALLCACSQDATRLTVQGVTSLTAQVSRSADDAEGINTTSTDLDLGDKPVSVTFRGLSIPQGATITSAKLQFKATEIESVKTVLNVKTAQGSVTWDVPAWTGVGQRGPRQTSPELASIVAAGTDVVTFTLTGTGSRTAMSYDRSSGAAPRLYLSYMVDDAPEPEPEPTPEPESESTPQPEPKPEPENAVYVTTLADAGAGSLRACLEASGPRSCVFKVGGTITLQKRIRVLNPYFTVDGSNAPGDGILLRGPGGDFSDPLLEIETHDFVVRHLRFRRGSGAGHDNLTLDGSVNAVYNGVIEHSSFTWATDENINAYKNVYGITWRYNIIAEPLHCSTHPKGCHGKNGAMGKYSTGSQTFHHNLIMSSHDRSLKLNSSYGVINFTNNVVYNNFDQTNITSEYATGPICINLVGNYWKDGPESTVSKPQVRSDSGLSVYSSGNIVQRSQLSKTQTAPCPGLPSGVTSAAQAYDDVLAKAGATLPSRDATDRRLVFEVKTGAGSFKNTVP